MQISRLICFKIKGPCTPGSDVSNRLAHGKWTGVLLLSSGCFCVLYLLFMSSLACCLPVWTHPLRLRADIFHIRMNQYVTGAHVGRSLIVTVKKSRMVVVVYLQSRRLVVPWFQICLKTTFPMILSATPPVPVWLTGAGKEGSVLYVHTVNLLGLHVVNRCCMAFSMNYFAWV